MFANHLGNAIKKKKWNPAHDPPPAMIPWASQTLHPPQKKPQNSEQMFTFSSQLAVKSPSSDLQEVLFPVLLLTSGKPFNFPLP